MMPEPWPFYVASELERAARLRLYGDPSHNERRCRSEGKAGRAGCEVCRVYGREAEDWARVYVEARRPVPRKWRAVLDALATEDARLARSIATFGVRFSR